MEFHPLLLDHYEFAEAYFDAWVCTDAYIYFGTDDLYLDHLHPFAKPGAKIGITVPEFMRELEGQLPRRLLPIWVQECRTWHTSELWRWHRDRTGLVDVLHVDAPPEGRAF